MTGDSLPVRRRLRASFRAEARLRNSADAPIVRAPCPDDGRCPRERYGAPSTHTITMPNDNELRVALVVNGREVALDIPGNMKLLELLREELRLTGTKCGCGHGACGACTVLVDGEPVRACRAGAHELSGTRVETIEGVAKNGRLDPVQRAFLKRGAYQCGYCTPGMILRIRGFLARIAGRLPQRGEIESELENHICRCGSYQRIFDAVMDAAAELQASGGAR